MSYGHLLQAPAVGWGPFTSKLDHITYFLIGVNLISSKKFQENLSSDLMIFLHFSRLGKIHFWTPFRQNFQKQLTPLEAQEPADSKNGLEVNI